VLMARYTRSVNAPGTITTVPGTVRACFWDVDANSLSWTGQRQLIIRRLLRSGDGHVIQWLLGHVTTAELGEWLRTHRGGGLSPQRLRYWQLILQLPATDVDAWVAKTIAQSWGARTRR